MSGIYLAAGPDCNFNCRGCFLHTPGAQNGLRLTLEEMRAAVDFARSRGGEVVVFAGKGEPVMDPSLPLILEHITEIGMRSVVFTNGTLITKKWSELLLTAGSVIAKRNSMNPVVQNDLAGVDGADAVMWQGVNHLLAARDRLTQRGVRVGDVGFDSYISRKNANDLPEVLRFCRRNAIIPYFEAFIELGQNPEMVSHMALSQAELTQLFLTLQKIDIDEFEIETKLVSGMRTYGQPPCDKWGHMVSVTAEGRVQACICGFEATYGSIHENSGLSVKENLDLVVNAANPAVAEKMRCSRCSNRINLERLVI